LTSLEDLNTSAWLQQLSPEDRALRDDLYREQLTDPQHLAFLAGLLKVSMRTMKRIARLPIRRKDSLTQR
jgi:hypothetical protein